MIKKNLIIIYHQLICMLWMFLSISTAATATATTREVEVQERMIRHSSSSISSISSSSRFSTNTDSSNLYSSFGSGGTRKRAKVLFTPSSIKSGEWVTVTWSLPHHIMNNTQHNNNNNNDKKQFICSEKDIDKAFCQHAVEVNTWIGIFDSTKSREVIGPQKEWSVATGPWLATSPVKWKRIETRTGNTQFKIENARNDLVFVIFRNGTDYPIEVTASKEVLSFSDRYLPRYQKLALTGNPTEMRVTFESDLFLSADDAKEEMLVKYGTSSNQYEYTVAAEKAYTYTKENLCGVPATAHGWWDQAYFYTAVMNNITPSLSSSSSSASALNKYYYIVGSEETGWSKEYSFKAPIVADKDAFVKIFAIADVGEYYEDNSHYHWEEPYAMNTTNGAILPWDTKGGKLLALNRGFGGDHPNSGKSGPAGGHPYRNFKKILHDDNADELPDVLLHVGDISYATGYGSEWDYFSAQIQPVSSVIPYMTGQGNHERDYRDSGSYYHGDDSGGECGIPTQSRFVMPTGKLITQDEGWYSFNEGPVHFIMMNTEMDSTKDSKQLRWIVHDLAAVNRKVTPWVIFSGHRPMYSSEDPFAYAKAQWADLEEVLVQYKVDLCLWGHIHYAELSCTVIKGECVTSTDGTYAGPVHATIGNGGQSLKKWPGTPEWSIWHLLEYGYSRIEADGSKSLKLSFYADQNPAPNALVHSVTLNQLYNF